MTLELLLAAVLVAGIILYAILGGADFGVGVWEFGTVFQSSEKEREHLYRAIGPVWEANHVWLIFILVILFSAFPPAFAGVSRALWVPLLLALVGIIFRGVGFAFRSYAAGLIKQQAFWGAIFSLASTATPFFLGAAFGAVASGHLLLAQDGSYSGNYFTDWISPFSIYSAFFFVGVSAYLSAVYLAREAYMANDPELIRLWRGRAMIMGLWMGILAMVGLFIIATDAPILWKGFAESSPIFVLLSILAGIASLLALWKKHFTAAVLFSPLAVIAVTLGWAVAQYPVLIPPAITLANAKSPDTVLKAMFFGLVFGSILLLPSLGFLFYLFKGKRPPSKETT
ncbi:MAG: cytochrome d ubiquinol oxidase subunit II [Deltaproteobacteria bacterium]|nr:cytochrome d ubiquinol oxidase subunit II [Deltaproteobacteria bacterium]